MTAVLLPLSTYRERKIGRIGGGMLLVAYLAYVVWRVAPALRA